MIDTRKNTDGLFPAEIGKKEASDTGMALVLICLIAFLFTGTRQWVLAGTGLLLLNMIWPMAFKYPAKAWLGLSHLLGTVMSKVILSLLFGVLVTPVGLFRRLIGRDSMQLKSWKGSDSAFVVRDHQYTAEDIEHPF